jgi:hypothetical protein
VGVSGITGSSGLNEFRTAINANIRASTFCISFSYFVIYGNDRMGNLFGCRGATDRAVEFGATIGELFCFARGAISGNDSWRQCRCDEEGDKCELENVYKTLNNR